MDTHFFYTPLYITYSNFVIFTLHWFVLQKNKRQVLLSNLGVWRSGERGEGEKGRREEGRGGEQNGQKQRSIKKNFKNYNKKKQTKKKSRVCLHTCAFTGLKIFMLPA